MRVIVTGAAGGIGAAVARGAASGRLIGQAATLLLVDRDADGLARTAAECPGAAVTTLVADLTDPGCGDAVATAAIAAMGGIDALVSNAGIILGGSLADLPAEDFDRMFAINTRATWLLAKAAYPHMKAAGGRTGGGRTGDGKTGGAAIVATGSISAGHATPALGAYSASKAALVMLVRQLANEWGPDGIRCNTVSPGPTLTGMTAVGYADAARRGQRESGMPLRRLGSPEDVADAILFLISDAARHVTGIDLLVDGGLSTTLMTASGAGSGHAGGV